MYIRLFFLVSILMLAIIPISNLVVKGVTRESIKDLYSIDIFESILNRVLVAQGISMNSYQVIVGNDRWFFLGDRYAKTRTMSRKSGKSKDIIEASRTLSNAQTAWRFWMKAHGVDEYSILIGPNKSTIYPEHTPKWAQPLGTSITDTLYAADVNNVYVDARESLKKSKHLVRGYYRTDTHWNNYGAGVAHQEFLRKLSLNHPDLTLLKSEAYAQTSTYPMAGGDLSSFLKIEAIEKDTMVVTAIEEQGIERFMYDFNSKELVYQGEGALFGDMNSMFLIKTPSALNDKKVLWLSDSFGTAQSQYMTASFNNVLKVHWGEMSGKDKLIDSVKSWKPNYVLVTVVEREVFSDAFKLFPPIILSNEAQQVTKKVDLQPVKLHQVKNNNARYTVDGVDPFLIYDFKNAIDGSKIPVLSFNINCLKPLASIPTQVFWRSLDQDFSAQNNIRFNAVQGDNQIQVPHWINQKNMTGIRIDLDGETECVEFSQTNVVLGNYAL